MNLIAVADLDVRLSPRRLRQHALRAGQHPLKLAGSGDVVGVHVRVEQQRRLEAHLGNHLRVPLGRDVHRVDDDRLVRTRREVIHMIEPCEGDNPRRERGVHGGGVLAAGGYMSVYQRLPPCSFASLLLDTTVRENMLQVVASRISYNQQVMSRFVCGVVAVQQ